MKLFSAPCGYIWDKAGNRSSMTDTAGPGGTYAVNNLNQYTSDGTNPIGSGSEHEMLNYQNISYTYINDTHLSSISGTDLFGQQSTYQLYYDALGRCAVRTLNGSTTYYIYDGEKPILEYGAAYVLKAANVCGRGIDEILKRTDYTVNPARVLYYQDDHEGSVTHLTDASGAVIESYTYDAFGKPTINGGAINASAYGNRFMFTGREYIATFGVYEYRNRAYHPGLGRFMSEDPKGFGAGDNNFFRYCWNSPAIGGDPMGLSGPLLEESQNQESDEQETETVIERVVVDNSPEGGHFEYGTRPVSQPSGNTVNGLPTSVGGANKASNSTGGGNANGNSSSGNGSMAATIERMGQFRVEYSQDNSFRQLVRSNNAHPAEIESSLRFARAWDRFALLSTTPLAAAAAPAIPLLLTEGSELAPEVVAALKTAAQHNGAKVLAGTYMAVVTPVVTANMKNPEVSHRLEEAFEEWWRFH